MFQAPAFTASVWGPWVVKGSVDRHHSGSQSGILLVTSESSGVYS